MTPEEIPTANERNSNWKNSVEYNQHYFKVYFEEKYRPETTIPDQSTPRFVWRSAWVPFAPYMDINIYIYASYVIMCACVGFVSFLVYFLIY